MSPFDEKETNVLTIPSRGKHWRADSESENEQLKADRVGDCIRIIKQTCYTVSFGG